jgi:hypothetical protein
MAEPILDASRIMARIGQGVAASVPEHAGVDLKGETNALADALNEPVDGVGRERSAAGR